MSAVVEKINAFLVIGGPVVWILMGFSIIAVTIGLVKIWQLVSVKAENKQAADLALQAWKQQDVDLAISHLSDNFPIQKIIADTIKSVYLAEQDMQIIREETQRRALNALHDLRSFLRPLEIIASLAPLLGLLGTVLGMITAFQKMQGAGAQVDPSVLSGGIWQALLTTAVGIGVAIPVVALHAWLERKIERIAHNMNDALTLVFTTYKPVHIVKKNNQQKALHVA